MKPNKIPWDGNMSLLNLISAFQTVFPLNPGRLGQNFFVMYQSAKLSSQEPANHHLQVTSLHRPKLFSTSKTIIVLLHGLIMVVSATQFSNGFVMFSSTSSSLLFVVQLVTNRTA